MKEKDFIKIDDLFRGRPDKEERVPPGAWRNMQELLDKAAITGGGTGGGRYGLYALFALLTLGLGTTALSLQHNQLAQIEAQSAFATIQDGGSASNKTNPLSAIPSSNGLPSNDDNNDKINNSSIAIANNAKDNTSGKEAISTSLTKDQSVPKAGNLASSPRNHSSHITKENSKKQNRARSKADKMLASEDSKILSGMQHAERASAAQPSKSIVDNRNIQSSTDLALQRIDESKFRSSRIEDAAYEAVLVDNSGQHKFVIPKGDDEWKKVIKEDVNKIVRNIRYKPLEQGKVQVNIDTVENTNYVRTRLEPLSAKDKNTLIAIASTKPGAFLKVSSKSISTTANTIAATTKSSANAATTNANLVPLSNFKVKSIEESKSLVHRFYEVMSNYVYKAKPYYFSGNVGAQTMFSQPMSSGFHLGLGVYYDFEEHYTFGMEFKYLYNRFAAQDVKDNYETYSNQSSSTVGGNTVYTALRQKYFDSYTLGSNTYLELPVTIKYQLSKLSLLGGVYGSYASATKFNVLKNQLDGDNALVSGSQAFVSTNPSVSNPDFKARFGLGFTLGGMYDFSKNVSLDLRINQNLWNSINTNSAMSQNLYRATGLQLSLYYFIGRKDKVMYMMAPK